MAMPGMLTGRILRSPHAHARIRSIDTSKAAALPGVKAVVTSKDFPEMKFDYVGPERVAQNFWHMTRNIMAREKVLYEGHAVAAVAAASKAVADEALALIAVDYEVLPHVIDVDEAMKPGAPLLFEDMITRGVEPAHGWKHYLALRASSSASSMPRGIAFAASRRHPWGMNRRGRGDDGLVGCRPCSGCTTPPPGRSASSPCASPAR